MLERTIDSGVTHDFQVKPLIALCGRRADPEQVERRAVFISG
jgi:hypothetical protein